MEQQLGDAPPSRVRIENVEPEINGGRFPAKRILNDRVTVGADIHAEGHDQLAAAVLYRYSGDLGWRESRMNPIGNDRWQGSFIVSHLGICEYTVEGWVDHFASWRLGLIRKVNAGQDVAQELLIGAALIETAAGGTDPAESLELLELARRLRSLDLTQDARIDSLMERHVSSIMSRTPDRGRSGRYDKILEIAVDPERARFSSWYELFPRSTASRPGAHGTFKDCEARLPDIVEMGFDVLYLPPVHPIGRTNRKGKNNTAAAGAEDVGSPWAIGAAEGGHTSVHPELGTLEDFRRLVNEARRLGIETALDLAFQCSPDHPWIAEHPSWFRHRPDGSIQYAENPPKRYEDIVPLDFETNDWKKLHQELLNVTLFWIEQGVRIFRVDNPHTKPYPFWEWMIREVKTRVPETIFLSEAFTRPKVMHHLAKIGFSQSYTYFTWRYTAPELTDYMNQLTSDPSAEYFRPNLWPNTPDILPEHLQLGGRPAFQMRLILAATLGSNYGIYGPAFELCESEPLGFNLEEYLNSEKYEIRHWDVHRPDSLRPLIAMVNRIRKENASLQRNENLRFHATTNPQLLAYTKHTHDLSNIVLTVVNLDVVHRQSGFIELPLGELSVDDSRPFQVHDLLTAKRYLWSGARNYVEIDPGIMPAHIFRLRRYFRTERDFDYYF